MVNEIFVAFKVNDSELDAAQAKADKLVATLERAQQLMQELHKDIDEKQKEVASTEKTQGTENKTTVNEIICDVFRLLIKEFEEQANNPHIHPPKMSVL